MSYPEAVWTAGEQIHRAKLDFHGNQLVCIFGSDMIHYVEGPPKHVNGVFPDAAESVLKSIEIHSFGSGFCEAGQHKSDGSETDTGEGEGDCPAGEDFEFLKDMASLQSFPATAGFMLSADKLFCNGKLLPFHDRYEGFSSCTSQGCDLCLPGQGTTDITPVASFDTYRSSLMARLPLKSLSFDTCRPCASAWVGPLPPSNPTSSPMASSALSLPPTSPAPSITMTSSALSSSMTSLALSLPPSTQSWTMTQPHSYHSPCPADTPVAPVLPKSNCKYSTKIKELFNFKVSASMDSSTCKLPIYPRSLWPFSRSNCAGESKTITCEAVPLPRRSNSAGVRIDSNTGSSKQDSLETSEATQSATSSSNAQTVITIVRSGESSSQVNGQVGSVGRAHHRKGLFFVNNVAQNVCSNVVMPSVEYSGGRVAARRAASSPGSISGHSPARRGSIRSAGIKVNAGKILLRNLERCTADRKLRRDAVKGSTTQSMMSDGATTMRVTPVLNMAMHICNSTNGRASGFGELFAKVERKSEELLTVN